VVDAGMTVGALQVLGPAGGEALDDHRRTVHRHPHAEHVDAERGGADQVAVPVGLQQRGRDAVRCGCRGLADGGAGVRLAQDRAGRVVDRGELGRLACQQLVTGVEVGDVVGNHHGAQALGAAAPQRAGPDHQLAGSLGLRLGRQEQQLLLSVTAGEQVGDAGGLLGDRDPAAVEEPGGGRVQVGGGQR
jgi:hypothetical protein